MHWEQRSVGFVRHAMVLFAVAALAVLWERLALQPPESTFRFGVLPEPVGDLKRGATILGLLLCVAAGLQSWVRPGPALAWLLHLGALVTVTGLFYGAITGLRGIQFEDPRPDSGALLATRLAGEVILGFAFGGFAWRVWRRVPTELRS